MIGRLWFEFAGVAPIVPNARSVNVRSARLACIAGDAHTSLCLQF